MENALNCGALLIDARRPRDYGLRYIEDAVNIAQVEHAGEHEEGDQLDDGEGVGDAARVEFEPEFVDGVLETTR